MSQTKPPPSLSLFPALQPPSKSPFFHRTLVLLITFLAYTSFHASRKPPSIVKSVLGPDLRSNTTNSDHVSDEGWPPFNASDGTHRLGELDLAFLLAYSFGMYFSGHLGDRYDLRVFLSIGMLGSGFLTIAFGFGYWLDVHSFSYFLAVQIVCGLFQSTGWPCVVAVVGNWFGEGENGMLMGIWNSHASFGNILGSIVASWMLQFGWGWCFLLPGLYIIFMSAVVYVFLVVSPEIVGFGSPNGEIELVGTDQEVEDESLGLLQTKYPNTLEETKILQSSDAIGFLEAWRLPGVVSYSLCLFFSKLVGYTFLYWLPFYIRHTAVAGVHFSHKTAGMLSTIFDIGGVLGGVLSGYVSDKIEARAVTSILFFTLSIFSLILYRVYGSISMLSNILLLFISGILVNGPYALITTAVAADLGSNNAVGGNSRALATVAAIIDGTGSVGASIGPLLAGYMSTRGWNSVFVMLIMSIFIAELFLIHIAKGEIEAKRAHKKWFWRKS